MNRVKIITTDHQKQEYWKCIEQDMEEITDCVHVLNVYPEITGQTVEGFGGAFTEAAAESFLSLDEEAREEFLEGYFGAEGLCYSLGRIHMNSCDFALGNYTYVEEGDETLETFNIEHDRRAIIPLVKKAMECAGGELSLLVSPWSPPAYMKTNGEMNHGGKLKKEYYKLWAQYYVKFILACKEEGLTIRYLTVQNEPAAVQTWDSCIYTGTEEGSFAADFLCPALREAGLSEIQVFIWDHNKEDMYARAKESFQVPGCRDAVSGVAVHWYTGDHFDGIRAVKQMYPEKKIFFTEGCVEYSRFDEAAEVQHGEMYAHDMLGNLKAGVEAVLDWNLLLDEKGGPNHVGNYCAAPVMCDGQGGLQKKLSYYYIGHFSRYIKPGAKQLMTSCYTDGVECLAFLNPDGERVVIILNRQDKDFELSLRENGQGVSCVAGAHSIKTIRYVKK